MSLTTDPRVARITDANIQPTTESRTRTRCQAGLCAAETAPPNGPHGSAAAPELSDQQVMTLGILIAGVTDPFSALMAAQMSMRDMGVTLRTEDARANGAIAEAAERERADAMLEAAALAERATHRMPSWVRKLVGAVLTIAGTVASCFSGGATAALAVIGAVMILGGEIVGTLAEKGMIDAKAGGIAACCLKLVGAVLMAVASCGAGAGQAAQAGQTAAQAGQTVAQAGQTAAQAGQVAAQVATSVTRAVSVTVNITQASHDIRLAAYQFASTDRQLDAEEDVLDRDEAYDRMDDAADELGDVCQRFERVVRRLRDALQASEAAKLAAIRAFA